MNFQKAHEMKDGETRDGWTRHCRTVNEGPNGQELGAEAVHLVSKNYKHKMTIWRGQSIPVK